MNRAASLARLADETFDVLIAGGGATGLGAAVDAAARGYRTALIEADDFASGTSSRSTKLIHGGIRYLQRGDIGLVREALHERTVLRRNAPHLVSDLAFVVPAYHPFEVAYYAAGLTAYDFLAGATDFPRSRIVGPLRARALVPGLAPHGLRGGVVYHDGQFDDARLAITLARTATARGAVVANYVRAVRFMYDANGHISGVLAVERESGAELTIRARAAINACGPFADAVRALDEPAAPPLLTHSRGSHIVVRADALQPATAALLVPRTAEGRVLFAIPWHEHVVIGTTDVPVLEPDPDPHPSEEEITYILATVNRYLVAPLQRRDILAVFAGLRPLISGSATNTAKLSREHLVEISRSGLVTITGGKWTTYRVMARDAVDAAARTARLAPAPSQTEFLPLHGALGPVPADESLRVYGSDANAVAGMAAGDTSLGTRLDPRLPYTGAHVVYGVRAEMARTVEDVLARRTRALFLDGEAARASAPRAASLIAAELGFDRGWIQAQVSGFDRIAAARQGSDGLV
ncbi:MAG: glycerol-3-phosphate dehydrogenase [Candidatus Eremiobacteraeota bacterium]|nr:glycerol-3-phosphate dehydrogenase [Candidatus Eremiobacteraeota bacterium]